VKMAVRVAQQRRPLAPPDDPRRGNVIGQQGRSRRATRSAIGQQFEMRGRRAGAHGRDGHHHILEVVEALLSRAVVERALAWREPERAVERHAHIRVGNADCGMVDAKCDLRGAGRPALPCRWTAIVRELQQLQRMTVRVTELVGEHAARCGRQMLRAALGNGRRTPHPLIGLRHIVDHQGKMLE
jgi:hypothetical protein